MLRTHSSLSGFLTAFALLMIIPDLAHAAGSGMPWEGPLEQIVNSITGPVAKAVGTLAVIASGVAIAFSEGGSGVRRFAWAGFGLSVVFAATSFFLPLFGFAGGATF